jgi:hypothetical protein
MGSEPFGDEIWDEFRWEQHINDIERKSVQLRDFITSTWGEGSPNWLRLLTEYKSQTDVIDAYIEEELMYEEAYFPEDDDWDDDEDDDPDNDLFMSEEEDEFLGNLRQDEVGDEDTDDFRIEDLEFLDDIRSYALSREFGIRVLELVGSQMEHKNDTILIQFVQTSLQISAKLAAGFSFGFDLEVIGGNIAYCKKALANSNKALELLSVLKDRPWMKAADYYEMHEALSRVRNEVGMYIQDLRESFRNSLF